MDKVKKKGYFLTVLKRKHLFALTIFTFIAIILVAEMNIKLAFAKLFEREQDAAEKIPLFTDKEELPVGLGDEHQNLPGKTKTTVVILLANQRSGSSFLGELFNQNPDAFYLFEPLFPYSHSCRILKQERVEALSRFARCDFANSQAAFKQALAVSRENDQNANCVRNGVCFLQLNRRLESDYGRECADSIPQSQCDRLPLNPNVISRVCRRSQFVVLKVIRICDVSTLSSLFDGDVARGLVDLKIVHLVRDPRAILSSRLKLIQAPGAFLLNSLAKEAEILCNRLEGNTAFADAYWEQGQTRSSSYRRIRYEDLARYPHEIARGLYDFIGFSMPSKVSKWIDASCVKNDSKAEIPTHWHSYIRKADDVLNGWRRRLTIEQVLEIQKPCADVFERHGYVTVGNLSELRNEDKQLW